MTTATGLGVLQRMTRRDAPATAGAVPLTAARATRLSMARAAEQTVGLVLTVASVSEDVLPLDAMTAALSDDLLLVGLQRGKALVGLFACDAAFVSAVTEMRTTGRVAPRVPAPRRATAADLALMLPFVTGLLGELSGAATGTTLEGWLTGIGAASRFDSLRSVGLTLPEAAYRLMRMSVDLGVAERTGEVVLVVPKTAAPAAVAPPPVADWSTQFQAAVLGAPAVLTAVLHRWNMSLHAAGNLAVGQVVPLPGCSVGAVRLEAADGTLAARGRLGQMSGQIAVRVATPEGAVMDDLSPGAPVYEAEAFAGGMDDMGFGGMAGGMMELPGGDDALMGGAMDDLLAEGDFPAMPQIDFGGDLPAET